MKELRQKYVAVLHAGQTLEQVDALYESGMRVALVEGAFSAAERRRLTALVKEIFARHNDPIGLMLRLDRDDDTGVLSPFQYVLLRGFTAAAAADWREAHGDFTGLVLLEGILGGDGVVTDDPDLAMEAARRGMLVLSTDEALVADGLLYDGAAPLPPRQEAEIWDETAMLLRCAGGAGDWQLGAMAILAARSAKAKAILVFTTDGANLSALSSLYPPLPLIAVAKRPEGEAMLLRQTMRFATLPTAITRVPESRALEPFARFIAELYGYQPGDSFVALGHWVEGENQNRLCVFTL